MDSDNHKQLAEQVLAGNQRIIARLITRLENHHSQVQTVLSELYPHTGQAHLIGVTGPPGSGKSSLVNELARLYRLQDKTVAILAVDPTSPFSGGAILGDRIRMRGLVGDKGVFIRSMASRGALGGLAWAVDDALKLLDAAGYDIILIETVGVGQGEVDIVRTAHTVLVVEAPGMGDDIQAIKAGILEIADLFVVNKADRPGADRAVTALRAMLELGHVPSRQMLHHGHLMTVESEQSEEAEENVSSWQVPVLKTAAIKGEGIEAVVETIAQHWQHLHDSGEIAERLRTRLLDELETILQAELMRRLLERLPEGRFSEMVTRLMAREIAPYDAVQKILAEI